MKGGCTHLPRARFPRFLLKANLHLLKSAFIQQSPGSEDSGQLRILPFSALQARNPTASPLSLGDAAHGHTGTRAGSVRPLLRQESARPEHVSWNRAAGSSTLLSLLNFLTDPTQWRSPSPFQLLHLQPTRLPGAPGSGEPTAQSPGHPLPLTGVSAPHKAFRLPPERSPHLLPDADSVLSHQNQSCTFPALGFSLYPPLPLARSLSTCPSPQVFCALQLPRPSPQPRAPCTARVVTSAPVSVQLTQYQPHTVRKMTDVPFTFKVRIP